jgi:hypothetical protein
MILPASIRVIFLDILHLHQPAKPLLVLNICILFFLDTDSDDSSNSGQEDDGQNKRNGLKSENGRKKTQRSPEGGQGEGNSLPDIEMIEIEKKPEKKPPDESL